MRMVNNMKNKLIPVFIIFTLISALPLFSKDKNGSLKAIEQAENSLKNLDSMTEIKQYIPSDIYNDAIINIINARSQWDKNEFLSAYFLGTVAFIKLEAARNFSLSKDNKYKKIMLELDNCKKKPSGQSIESNKLNAILNSGLAKKADVLTLSIMDKNLFKGNDFKISNEGISRLSGIIEVLKLFPECTVKIAGHSSSFDYKSYTKIKAEAVLKYLIISGINESGLSSIGLGNIEVMDTPVGYRRLDRIEIIISGIKL